MATTSFVLTFLAYEREKKRLLKSYQYSHSGNQMRLKWSVVTPVSTIPWSVNEDKYLVTKCERKGTHLEVIAIGKETFGNKNLSNRKCAHGLNNAQIKLVQIWSYRCTGIPTSANNPQIKLTKMYHLTILSDANNQRSGNNAVQNNHQEPCVQKESNVKCEMIKH